MKLCKKCKKEKDRSCFHNDKGRKDGLFPYCKDCRREISGSKRLIHKKIGEVDGYIVVDRDRYPAILLPGGSERVHRYVARKKIGRELKDTESVHHIDGNKKNWDESNLVVINDGLHRRFEGHKAKGFAPKLTCTTCGKQKKYSNRVIKKGRIIPDRYQCSNCYYKSGGPGGRSKMLRNGHAKNLRKYYLPIDNSK